MTKSRSHFASIYSGWTQAQVSAVRESFGPRLRKRQAFGIEKFIRNAATWSQYNQAMRPPSKSEMKVSTELKKLGLVASKFANALSSLSKHAHGALWAGIPQQFSLLERLKQDALAIQSLIHEKAGQSSRGDRALDSHALALTKFLAVQWFSVFRQQPALTPQSEFHKVASTVAKHFRLTIGSKTIRKVRAL
jgi:hypothetical protein